MQDSGITQVPGAPAPRGANRCARSLWPLVILLLSACGGGGGSGSDGGSSNDSDTELPSLQSITLAPDSALIEKHEIEAVQVTAHLSDGGSTTSLSGVDWSSEDSSVAEISAASGSTAEITGTGLGDATITATFAGEVATVEIGVTAALESLQVEPTVLELPEFDTEQLVARAIYSDGSSRDVTTLASWTASRPAVATVASTGDGAGTVEAVDAADDPVVVVAEYRGLEASAEVAVVAAPPTTVTVTPGSPTVHLGETLPLTATATYPGGVERDQTDDATWTSDNDDIVTAEGGLLVPVSAGGPATVTAEVGGTTGTAEVTVDPAQLESLAVTPGTLNRDEGSVYRGGYTLTATYTGTGDEPVTADEVTWSSSDPTVAFVSNATGSAGEIAAIAPGSATITATLGTVSADVAVTVVSAPDQPGELNLSAVPDVILSGGSDTATVLARVSPNDLEDGISQDGLTVLYSIVDAGDPGSLSADQATTDANGEASVTFTAGTAGTTTIKAELEVGLSHTLQVRTVDSFAQVFDTDLQTDLDIVGDVIQSGSSFTLTLYNGSNREFELTNLSVTNGGGLIHDEPNPLGGTTGDLRRLPYTFTFDSGTPDNGITVTVDLREPSTGNTFSIVREVTPP